MSHDSVTETAPSTEQLDRALVEATFIACHKVAGKYSGACAHKLRQEVDLDKIIAGVKP